MIHKDYCFAEHEGNYIWAAAMTLAWKEMISEIIHEDLISDTQNKEIQHFISVLNKATFSKDDLDEESYYIKCGFGQPTLDIINYEYLQKFKNSTFGKIEFEEPLKIYQFVSVAYILKQIKYLEEFQKDDGGFLYGKSEWKRVDGFKSRALQNLNIKDVLYRSNEQFVVGLELKDQNDELFLAKGFEYQLDTILDTIKNADVQDRQSINCHEDFWCPEIHFDFQRDYQTPFSITNQTVEQPAQITVMYQKVKFDMDNVGVRLENLAVIVGLSGSCMCFNPEQRKFIINKPYWIIMKRKNSTNPYFIARINNTAYMTEYTG